MSKTQSSRQLGSKPEPIAIEAVDPESPDAVWCLEQYFFELEVLFDAGLDASKAHPVDADDLRPPRGVCLVARSGGRPLGTGSLKPLQPNAGYIKRMWVAQEARGLGLGKRILAALEEEAKKLGYEVVRLETKREPTRATSMYRKHGYYEVERFNEELYGDFWFEKRLA